jgi:hypothetical protein
LLPRKSERARKNEQKSALHGFLTSPSSFFGIQERKCMNEEKRVVVKLINNNNFFFASKLLCERWEGEEKPNAKERKKEAKEERRNAEVVFHY